MKTRAVVFALAASLIGGAPSQAADPARDAPFPLVIGERVRLALRDVEQPVVGEVTNVDPAGLTIRVGAEEETRRLSWSRVRSVQTSLGRRPDHGGGAATGAVLIGVPLGLLAGKFCLRESVHAPPCPFSTQQAFAGAAAGAAVGGLLGLAVGSIKSERWRRVERMGPQVRLHVLPQPRGAYAQVSVAF